MKKWFQEYRHQIIKNGCSCPWKAGTNNVGPMITQLPALRWFAGCGVGREGRPRQNLADSLSWKDKTKSLEWLSQLEFAGKSGREERSSQRDDSQKPPLVFTRGADQLLRKHQRLGKESLERIRRHSAYHSCRPGIVQCFHQPDSQASQFSEHWWGRVLRRSYFRSEDQFPPHHKS